jgi:uncharacterized protein GlcG (DUF336 family)
VRHSAWLFLVVAACDHGPPAALTQAPLCPGATPLTAVEIRTVIAQAAGRALADGQAHTIGVVNREGIVVGMLRMAGGAAGLEPTVRAKGRTAAFLSSDQHAFTTRTAAFIIEDHFPPGLRNVPGGPLYGVQFSNLAGSDIVGEAQAVPAFDQQGNGLSGDPGSMPLYKDGCLVGGVGIDGSADAAFEERAAWTASAGFRPAPAIWGSQIHVDGVRLDFMAEMPPDDLLAPAYADLLAGGATEIVPPFDAPPEEVFPASVFGGLSCDVRFPPADSARAVPAAERLLAADVTAILDAAAARSDLTRAGIRRPIGTSMRCFISVADIDGTVLGSIRTPEATLFSFDVSVQKARTAAFFSSDAAAFTCRALGFLAQAFFPPGIDAAPEGPLHLLQDALGGPIAAGAPPTSPELANGITVFPGAVPLYKGGVLVGAIGVSGDGVDQDDFIAAAGGDLFPPPPGARCDELDEATAVAALRAKVELIRAAADAVATDPLTPPAEAALAAAVASAAVLSDSRLATGLQGLRLPYVKFPRQPFR